MNVASKYFKVINIQFKHSYKILVIRYGIVERVIIYKEKQSDSVDDDSDTIIKIFVEFTQMLGNYLFFNYLN